MSRLHAVFYAGETAWNLAEAEPSTPWTTPAEGRRLVAPRRLIAALRAFYRDPVAWLALVTTSILLCYGGGVMMFWFHAVALEEGGPAISWYTHWLLDSTFGFVALTPALFLILPFAVWASQRLAGHDRTRVSWFYVAIAAGLFSLVTVPGPIAHDMIVGRGTWIADRVTGLLGDPSATLTPVSEYPVVATLTQQLGAAVPTYLVTVAVSLLIVRTIMARRQRADAIEVRAAELGQRGRAMSK